MVRRDPQTGQFVSGDTRSDVDWTDTKRIGAGMGINIPAADLAGATDHTALEGESAKIVDFSDQLENDEVYVLHKAQVAAFLNFPTTATAESSGGFAYQIGPESRDVSRAHLIQPFYHGSAKREHGIIDINQDSGEAGGVWAVGHLAGEASLGDSTNGLGAGADNENERYTVDFGDTRPVYDRDDELYAVSKLWYDNISDHAIGGLIRVLLHGHVESLD